MRYENLFDYLFDCFLYFFNLQYEVSYKLFYIIVLRINDSTNLVGLLLMAIRFFLPFTLK